jgi:hypothetical protein
MNKPIASDLAVSCNKLQVVHSSVVIALLLLISGCAIFQSAPGIVGKWHSEIQGFPVELSYTESTVGVNGSEPVPYTIEDNTVTLVMDDVRTYRVEFPSRDEMIQIDDSTGARQSFRRID